MKNTIFPVMALFILIAGVAGADYAEDIAWAKERSGFTGEYEFTPRLLPVANDLDENNNRVSDALEDKIEADTTSDVRFTVMLKNPVSDELLTGFLATGGTLTHVFDSAFYGFSGIIPSQDVQTLTSSLGNDLYYLEEDLPTEPRNDKAAQIIRARTQVWSGYGLNGSANNSIAVLDTGIDDSHTDLGPYANTTTWPTSNKMVAWHDATDDATTTPQDYGHHGTHVAGSAAGTGAQKTSSATQQITTTASGSWEGLPEGYGYCKYFDAADGQDITLTLTWRDGDGAAACGIKGDNGTWLNWTGDETVSAICAYRPQVNGTYQACAFCGTGATNNVTCDQPYSMSILRQVIGLNDGFNLYPGVAPNSKVVGVKVFENNGTGWVSDMIAGANWVINNKNTYHIKVVTMSAGVSSGGTHSGLRSAASNVVAAGMPFTISAGNGYPSYKIGDPKPANGILVGATDNEDRMSHFSSQGTGADGFPHVVAPGGGNQSGWIESADSNDLDGDSTLQNMTDVTNDDYTHMQGTSMATPLVAGMTALIIDAIESTGTQWGYTEAEALSVKNRILMTATEINAASESTNIPTLDRGGHDKTEGYGRVNADAAIESVLYYYTFGSQANVSLNGSVGGRRAWARMVNLTTGEKEFNLTVPTGCDADIYLYNNTPDGSGTPQILSSSVNAGSTDDRLTYNPSGTETHYLVIKRVTGTCTVTLDSSAAAVSSSTVLSFDDGTPTGGWLLTDPDNDLLAVWFNTTLNYLETIRFYIHGNPNSAAFTWYVYNGTPTSIGDDWVAAAFAFPTTTGWFNITVNENVSDDFWVIYRTSDAVEGYPAIGYDRTAPIDEHSRYSANNGQVWTNWTSDDIMIRAVVSSAATTTTTTTSTTSTTSTSTTSTSTTIVSPYMAVDLLSPNTSTNLTNGTSMNFTATVTCVGGDCGNVTATLDPIEAAFASPAEGFRAAYGDNWNIEKDGNRIRVLGGGISPDGISLATTSAQLDSVTRDFLRLSSQVFDLNEADLKTLRIDADMLPEKIAYYLYYTQNYDGIPVEDSYVMVAYKNDKIVEIKSKFFSAIELDTRPEITLEDAADAAREMVGIPSGIGPVKSELVIFPLNVDKDTIYMLSWKIGFPMVPETNGSWTFIVDANNGSILKYWDTNKYQVSGTVTGKIYQEKLSEGQITKNFSNLYVNVQEGDSIWEGTTNDSGFYNVTQGSGSVNVYSYLKGTWVWVINEDAAESVHNQSVTAGTTHSWDWDADDTSDRNEESNIFYHINQIHDFYTSGAPLNITSMNYMINATVEYQTGLCNAFYSGNSESMFFGAGNLSIGCENLALFSDVIYHEYTHGVVDHIYPVTFPYIDETGAMNEGWSDYFALTINNNSLQGEEALSNVRDLNNTQKFLDDWVNEVHDDSTQFSGAHWDLRAALGKETVDALVISAIKLLPFSFSEELDDMLISDDDNANLADGTPNINTICNAYYDNHDISSGYCANHTLRELYNVTFLKYYTNLAGWYPNTELTFATKFTPPSYPANITKFKGVFALQNASYLTYTVHLYADNSGEPGAELITPVSGTIGYGYLTGGVYSSVVNISAQITSGSFWAGVEISDEQGPFLASSSTSTSTSKINTGSGWQDAGLDDLFISVGVKAYLAPPMPTTTTTTTIPGATTTTTTTSTTTTLSYEKGVVPMNSGSPFYTTDDNPRYPNNLSCLQDMASGNSCSVTWLIFANGPYLPYTFYATANATTIQNESSRINITILEPPQIRLNEFMPNPSSGLEWIELYNLGSSNVTLNGWQLNNSADSYSIVSEIITGGGFSIFYSNVTSLTLNDSYGTIYLLYPNNSISDNITYNSTSLNSSWSSMPSGISVGRETDGTGSFTTFTSPTPNSGNTAYSQIALVVGWNLISIPLVI